ncbi:MAG: PAS domain S-box protein [Spirochaetia bacterium]|nr:PAS domain S-box protein [Spirochaetia bacterium]
MSKKILLVEDEALIAMNEARMLEKHGYEVVTVYNGEKAIEAVDSDPAISLILMDVNLEMGIDGTEAAERILEKHDLPVVFLSSHTDPETVEKTEGISSYGYVVKNSSITVLDASIKMAFRLYNAHLELKTQKRNLNTALTKYEQTAEELYESEQKYRFLADNVQDIVWLRDLGSELPTYVSPSIEKIIGYTPEEVLSMGAQNIHTKESYDRQRVLYKELVDKKLTTCGPVEHEVIHKDGHTVPIEVNPTLIWDEADIPSRVVSVARDISTRKQAEDALRENSKTAHQFFSESAAGAFFMMLDEPIEWNDSVDKEKVLDYVFDHQRISQINKAMLDQYLAREEEFLGKTPEQLFAHEVEHGRSLWWKMFDQGFLSIDSNERRFDGSQLWIVGSYRCMYDEQGRITGHFGTQHDITELKQAEEKLRLKSSFIDRIAEVSPDLFIIYKRDGEYMDIITANKDNLFLKREELLGSKIPEVLPETAAATIMQGIDDALTTNSLKVVEYELGIDNQIFDFEARITPLEEDRVLAQIIDITERKQLEDQLKKNEERFKTIFYNSEVSLWEEDFSEVRKIIDGLKKEGVKDFYRYFDNNPDVVWDLAKKIDVIDINDATLKLYGADSKEVMLGSLDKTLYLTENTYELLRDEFVAIAEKRTSVKGEMRTRTLYGEVRDITMGVYISKEKDIKVVAINDITPYKNALKEKDFLMRELNHRVKNNLNMVSSLISLKDVEIDYDLSDLKNRIDAIRLVHEKLHQSGEVEQIKANEYTYEILESVFSSFSDREVAVVSTVENINLKPKTLVPLGIVINEIATNAVKYGFTDTEEARFSVAV